MYEKVLEHLKETLEVGVIWPSHSPWASPVLLVSKKGSELQFCINLRKLNAHTIIFHIVSPGYKKSWII